MQIIEQTDEEKLTMYMKLSKQELAKMLIESNKHLLHKPIVVYPYVPPSQSEPFWQSPNPWPTTVITKTTN